MIEFKKGELTEMAKALFKEERAIKRLDGWFLVQETQMKMAGRFASHEIDKAEALKETVKILPLNVSNNAVFVGTQRDSFARSYALINPAFKVEEFCGYCDATAVFDDIEPNDFFTAERINKVREYMMSTDYVRQLSEVYGKFEDDTKEVTFFVEQVTGHLIPDFRQALKLGVKKLQASIKDKEGDGYRAMEIALECVLILAERYKRILEEQYESASPERKIQLELMIKTLNKVPANGAEDLFEAIQMFILLWQVMCLEQAPNPFAFSVGNADRIFELYSHGTDHETAAELFKHFLVFFNVADRSWAISQNIIIGGRDVDGNDLTNDISYAIMDAYFDMNLPQPILSVKLHKNTPEKFYEAMGKFLFSPGVLTPSFFNDDSLYEVLGSHGIEREDLPDISIAGCQEPLIMGKDNGNTTNSWLNLPKILELTLTGGYSTVTGEKLANLEPASLKNIREAFYKNTEYFAERMRDAANGASKALSNLRVPFLSCFMGGLENGIDLRDTGSQGTKYNGSGCLIHGVSVVADSFIAIDKLLEDRPQDAEKLVDAIRSDFKNYDDLKAFLKSCPKFGNNIESVDEEARDVANRTAEIVRSQKNYLNNSFRPDFSSPSTHLLYGYWVGATPDGRNSREMLGYGVDPLFGDASNGMGFRVLSTMKLPFDQMNGGYASHMGIDPKYFKGETFEEKGLEFERKIIKPLFFNPAQKGVSPFYLYVNVTTPEILRKVLADPKKYAPSGVYIMRIHGTFVNFLDLSPAIQQDIIKRLDPKSTSMVS
ncbi:MAG: pyruvate formate lyase family protein [Firmicutes bacterium]|nr:pyruvate formate lyase family protein [Bacillota bacterium]